MKFARAQVRQMMIKFARDTHLDTAEGKNIGTPAAEDSSVTPVLKSSLHDAVLQLLSITFLKEETQCLQSVGKWPPHQSSAVYSLRTINPTLGNPFKGNH